MKRRMFSILLVLVVLLSIATTAYAYGTIVTSNGYVVTDHCDFWRSGPFCYCDAYADVYHQDTGAYKNHYSVAQININGRYGTSISSSGRCWCGNQLRSTADTRAENAAVYAGYGWWGGVVD